MYTYLCKVFHHLHARPRLVLALAFLLTLAAALPLRTLEIRTAFSDLLPENFASVKLWRQIGEKFGGLGNLTVVIHSPDYAANVRTARALAKDLRGHRDVNFLEFRTEADFYKAHKLLYMSLADLREVEKRVETGFWLARKKNNPMILDLLDDEEKQSSLGATHFDDLEKKYFARLQEYLGTPDGTTILLRVYPDFDITDITRCRAFLREVRAAASRLPHADLAAPAPELLFTGDLVRNVQNDGRLYSQIIDLAKWALILSAALLLVYFLRLPAGLLLALIPLAMAGIWTLALTALFIGHLSLVSAPLSLLLSGIGLNAAIQLLTRYREERRKNFSAAVAFETIVLETGPAITTGALVTGAAFFMLTVTEFKGFAEFGLMAGMGMLCILAAVLLVFPCLLILAESRGLLPVPGARMRSFGRDAVGEAGFPWRRHLLSVALLTVVALHRGPQFRFQFNLDKLAFPNRNLVADSLVQAAGEAVAPPAVALAPNQEEAGKVADALRRLMAADTVSPTIQSVTTLTDLLPADQDEKLAIIARLKKTVMPGIIANSPEPLKSNLEKLRDSWEVRKIGTRDLPANYRKKFLGKDGSSGQFTFIFPSVDLRQGSNNLDFADDVRDIPIEGGGTYHASGQALVQADLLKLIIPDTLRALLLALITIGALVFLDVKSLRATAVLILPLLFSLLWTLGVMKIAGIKLNWFNLVAFPALLAFGISHGAHFYHRYLEEGKGSLRFVLRRTGEGAMVATLVGMAGFVGLAFSEHRGLASLGQTALIGLCMSLLAPLLIMPMIIGYLEEKGNIPE